MPATTYPIAHKLDAASYRRLLDLRAAYCRAEYARAPSAPPPGIAEFARRLLEAALAAAEAGTLVVPPRAHVYRRPHSEATRAKISESMRGRAVQPALRDRISTALRDRPRPGRRAAPAPGTPLLALLAGAPEPPPAPANPFEQAAQAIAKKWREEGKDPALADFRALVAERAYDEDTQRRLSARITAIHDAEEAAGVGEDGEAEVDDEGGTEA